MTGRRIDARGVVLEMLDQLGAGPDPAASIEPALEIALDGLTAAVGARVGTVYIDDRASRAWCCVRGPGRRRPGSHRRPRTRRADARLIAAPCAGSRRSTPGQGGRGWCGLASRSRPDRGALSERDRGVVAHRG